MYQSSWLKGAEPTILNRLSAWNAKLKAEFPTRLVGELELSEADFRELLSDTREMAQKQSLVRPPSSFFPRLTLALMTFTARYDYEGAFWPAFQGNLGLSSIDRAGWGLMYRRALKAFKLFEPPDHWMVNVFPVLFHSIVPERSLEDFALMVRALCDTFDIRLLDDRTLGDALDSAELPLLLRRFVTGNESRAVAQELVRHVAEDFRLGVDLGEDTLRGRILKTMRNASEISVRAFDIRVHPVPWRWDLNSGRCGIWLASSRPFVRAPISLEVAGVSTELRSNRILDEWRLVPEILTLSPAAGGKYGAVTSYGENLLEVHIGTAPSKAPYVFRASGNSALFEPNASGTSGDYAIVTGSNTRVLRDNNELVESFEQLQAPSLAGATSAGLYSLNDGDRVLDDEQCIFTVRRATRPSVELRGRTAWEIVSGGAETPIYPIQPRLEVRSPQVNAAFVLFEGSKKQPICEIPFVEELQLRPTITNGLYRASVSVDGRSAGATSVEFAILPIYSEIVKHEGRLVLSLTGEGAFKCGRQLVGLDKLKPSLLDFSDLQIVDEISYAFNGQRYLLRYVGLRPTLWGLERSTVDQVVISTRVDCIALRPDLIVSGVPGASISLEVNGMTFTTSKIARDGFATVSLANCIAIARGREAITVDLRSEDFFAPALAILSVPQVGYDGISASWRGIRGDINLDSAVDELRLEAHAFHAPWTSPITTSFNGLGQRWEIDTQLPNQRWELSLSGTVGGVQVTIMRDGAPWAKSWGAASDRRTELDEYLYFELSANHEIDEDRLRRFDVYEIVVRLLTMLSFGTRRKELERIKTLLKSCAQNLLVRDVTHIENQLAKFADSRLTTLAASCGLPVAAFQQLPFEVATAVKPTTEREIYGTFLQMAAFGRSSRDESSLAPVLLDLESDAHPLVSAYARLLRQLQADGTGIASQLEQKFRSRLMSEACLDVHTFGSIEMWTGAESDETSLFALITRRLWALATIARHLNLLDASDVIPKAVHICSALIADQSVGELTRIALCWVEQDSRHLYSGKH